MLAFAVLAKVMSEVSAPIAMFPEESTAMPCIVVSPAVTPPIL